MKKILGFLVLLSLNVGVFAQAPLDSLFGIWGDESQPDTIRLNAMNEFIYGATGRIGPDSMLVLANEMYARATEIGSKRYLVDAIIQQSRSYAYMRNIESALEAAHRASGLAEEIEYHYGHARALGVAAGTTSFVQDPVHAIEYYNKSNEAAIKAQTQSADNAIIGDIAYFPWKNFIPKYHNDVGLVYQRAGSYVNALEHFEIALKANLIIDNQLMVGSVYNNIGIVHMGLDEWDKAMEYLELALPVFEKIGHKAFQANVLGNMAGINIERKSYDEAETYLNRMLKIREEMSDSLGIGQAYLQFAHLYTSTEDYQKALKYAESAGEIFIPAQAKRELTTIYLVKGYIFDQQGKLDEAILIFDEALKLADEIQSLNLKKSAIESLYQAYKKKGQTGRALEYHEELLTLSDSLNIDETGKKLLQVEFSTKHMTDSLLQQEETIRVQLAHDKEILQQTNTRNIMLGSGLILLLVSGGLWNRLSFTRKSKAALQEEKDLSENLLLNILPAEVAEELKQNGEALARDFDLVSIIFTDFKDFTLTSANLSAGELVDELNYCFKGFDTIMEKYGIEKIKTIGDAYMAAGGIPVATPESPQNTVLATLEISEYVAQRKKEREAMGKIGFEMRCGIHTGPVVAGIVGVKKFQYDIWGDTVNTASRMESYGEVGKVNISQDTYALIQDVPGFTFEKRGKIDVKGKGEMDMYFVGGAVGG